MEINKEQKDNKMIIKVSRKLDTNTAPELEEQVSNFDNIEKLIFDFEDLDYIASSGLRVLLKCKKQVDDTSIINCNPEVFEIFNITGFSEMMDVKKAFRRISIDNCEKIGEGFFGNIYRIDPETIVKVYKVPDCLDMITRERELSKKAFVMGIPTAIPYDIVKVGEQYGAVFELLNAESTVDIINNDEALDNFAKKCVDVLKKMHNTKLNNFELPSRREAVKQILNDCKKCLSDETYNKLLYLLDTIPETNTMLHCDFHVKNLMLQNDELLLIDMDTLSTGHPIFEFASIYATYIGYSCVDKHNTDKFLKMPLDTTTKLFYRIFENYYNDKSKEEMEDMISKISIISYIQILNTRAMYSEMGYGTEKEEVEFCVNYLTEKAKTMDSLNY